MGSKRKKILGKTAPGLQGVTFKELFLGVIQELKNDNLIVRASSMSFFFFLAIFPTIIFFFSLIPYIPVDGLDIVLLSYLSEIIPFGVFESLEATINDIIKIQRGGVTSFNFLMAFVFSSTGITAMLNAFNKNDEFYKKRNFFSRQLVSLKLIILISIMFLASISLVILGEETIRSILMNLNLNNRFTYYFIVLVKYFLIFFAFFNAVALIYYYAPAVKEKFRYFSIGAIFTSTSLVVLSNFLKIYFNLFSNFNQLYGSLGVFIVTMLFVYFNCIILLLGFEINNSILKNKE